MAKAVADSVNDGQGGYATKGGKIKGLLLNPTVFETLADSFAISFPALAICMILALVAYVILRHFQRSLLSTFNPVRHAREEQLDDHWD
jgi:ABC-type spermidine/putrescine transport system permease subunit I